MAQDAEVGCAEGVHAPVRGLGDLARRLDLVVQQNKHTAAPAVGTGRRAHAVHEIDRGIGRQTRGRPLRADQHDGHIDLEHQVQDPGRLFQRRRAVTDDDAGEVGMLGDDAMAESREFLPLGEVDLGARHVAEINRDYLGDLVDHRKAFDDLTGMHPLVVDAVVLQLERMNAERRDGAARPDEGHLGPLRAAHAILLRCSRTQRRTQDRCRRDVAGRHRAQRKTRGSSPWPPPCPASSGRSRWRRGARGVGPRDRPAGG